MIVSVLVPAPKGAQSLLVTVCECECGCEEWFAPKSDTQVYINAEHRQALNNQRRPPKTDRRVGVLRKRVRLAS